MGYGHIKIDLNKMDEIRWGIIGCGDVAEVKSGPALSKVPHSELIAVMRRDATKAADYAKRHKVPNWYANAELLISDPRVNAIYVATPPDTHAYYAKKAIEAGKAVYIEKPMCKTFAECEEINQLANAKNVPVFVAYYRRRLPSFVKVKELIDEGKIGKVRMVSIQLNKHPKETKGDQLPWRVNAEIAGAGHFYDLASHQFDFLDYLFGPIAQVSSIVDNQMGIYEAEDIVSVAWQFENGVVGSGTWCFNAAPQNDCDLFEIIGSEGRIEFSTFDFTPIRLINSEGNFEFDFPKPENVQFNLIEQVVNHLRGTDEAVSTGVSAARTNEIIEKIVTKFYHKNNH